VSPEHRIPSLDGWRAVGVTLVLVSHMPFTTGFPEQHADQLVNVFDGELGVRIFFVLSGFLITSLLLKEANTAGAISLKRFYIRRALRILPIYVVYLLVLAVLSALGLYSDTASSWIGALTFTRNLVGHGRSATVQLWSLAVEEQFYLLWPLTLGTFALWRRPRVCVSALLLVMIACPILRATLVSATPGGSVVNRLLGPYSGLMFADSLVVGCLAAFFVTSTARVPAWLISPALPGLAIASIVAGRYLQVMFAPAWVLALVPSVQALAVMYLIWMTAFQPPGLLARLLDLRPVALFGTLSYSIYVWQFLFISHFVPAFRGVWTHDWKWWMFCAVAVAAASYYGVEKPFLTFKQRFSPTLALPET
jgi:peptidoglycan/LPS O-acetylase OafA/YrhL